MPKKKVDNQQKFCYCCRKVGSFCRSKGQLRPYCNKCYVNYPAKERKERTARYLLEIFIEDAKK
jgi:hypothetical protein